MDGEKGYNIVTPLIRENGTTVFVNRGWISEEFAELEKRVEPTGTVEIEGMLRASPARNYFTPDNHPEKGEWYWADLEAMVEFAGGEKANAQPVYIEETFGAFAKRCPAFLS
jgi:surfeit locus 1 family protein